jgi:hypothetical protein
MAKTFGQMRMIGKSKYKHVSIYKAYTGEVIYVVRGNKANQYNTEREAGIQVDLSLIKQGKEPVNILKRK